MKNKTLVINPDNEKDFNFLKELLNKLGYDFQELTEEEREDLGLLKAMVQEKKEEYVSEDEIRKTLGTK